MLIYSIAAALGVDADAQRFGHTHAPAGWAVSRLPRRMP